MSRGDASVDPTAPIIAAAPQRVAVIGDSDPSIVHSRWWTPGDNDGGSGQPGPGEGGSTRTPNGTATQIARPQAGRMLTASALGGCVPVVYGIARIGGDVMLMKVSGTTLYIAYRLCEGPVQAIANVKVGGRTMANLGLGSAGAGQWDALLGTPSQAVVAALTGIEALWLSGLPSTAYVWAALPARVNLKSDVNPLDFVADVSGRLLRDPRRDATLVSRFFTIDGSNHNTGENPVLQMADLMTDRVYGVGIADADMDWSGSITDGANYCDALLSDGITHRFRTGGIIRDKSDAKTWMDTMRAHCGALIVNNGGVWQIRVDQPRSYSGLAFTDTGTAANIVGKVKVTTKGTAETPNRVIVHFTDTLNGYADSAAEASTSALVTTLQEESLLDLNLQFCPTHDQANRCAVYHVNRATLADKILDWTVTPEGTQALPDDRVQLTSILDSGISAYDVSITDIEQQGMGWVIKGEPYNAAIFNDTIILPASAAPSGMPDPYAVPAGPTVNSIAVVDYAAQGDVMQSRVQISITPPTNTPFYYATRVYLADGTTGTPKLIGDFQDNLIEIVTTKTNLLHTFTLYSVLFSGVFSTTPTTAQVITSDPTLAPIITSGAGGGTSRTAVTVINIDTATCQTQDTHALDANVTGFFGACFDGRYVYAQGRATTVDGKMMQFDTTKLLTDSTAYVFRDGGVANGGLGCAFDGRYVYFTFGNTVQQFDTLNINGFNNSASWLSFSRDAGDSFSGGMAFDGTNVYFGGANSPRLVRFAAFDANGNRNVFTTAGNWSMLDLSTVDASYTTPTFRTMAFDGQYLYGAPETATGGGKIWRYNTKATFTTIGNYTVLDLTTIWAAAGKFFALLCDGRFLWLTDTNTSGFQYLRFDTSRGFTDKGGWDSNAPPSATSPWTCVFDGRYLYFIGAKMVRLDTFGPFKNSTSYQTLDPTTIDATMTDFAAGAWDRNGWVYMIPRSGSSNVGKVLRHPAPKARVLAPTRPAVDGTTAVLRAQEFTAGGTWTAPINLKNNECFVTAVAGGGAGGSTTAAANAASGGGGAGAYCFRKRLTVSPGTGYTITVGAGGTAVAGAAGNAGTSSLFGALLTLLAGGGGGGGAGASGLGGSGGSPGGADGSSAGAPGAPSPLGGFGGAGVQGSGGNGGYGAGGGGTANGAAAVAHSGGVGGAGYVLIEWNE